MPSQNSDGDQLRDWAVSLFPCSIAWSVAARAARFCLFSSYQLRNAGIEIPAVVVKARLAGKSLDLGAGLLLQMREADHDVGHLHASVVDVVLDVDFPSGITQQANERVAEDGVAQVSNVRGFVGINARVLDQNLARRNIGWSFPVSGKRRGHPAAVDFYI